MLKQGLVEFHQLLRLVGDKEDEISFGLTLNSKCICLLYKKQDYDSDGC